MIPRDISVNPGLTRTQPMVTAAVTAAPPRRRDGPPPHWAESPVSARVWYFSSTLVRRRIQLLLATARALTTRSRSLQLVSSRKFLQRECLGKYRSIRLRSRGPASQPKCRPHTLLVHSTSRYVNTWLPASHSWTTRPLPQALILYRSWPTWRESIHTPVCWSPLRAPGRTSRCISGPTCVVL